MNNDVLAFVYTEYRHLLPDAPKDLFAVKRYPNGELTIQLNADVTGKSCAILGTIAPPDENLLGLLNLAYTLKKEGAAKVAALLPYLAYTREDKDEPGKSCSAALTGQLLKSAGVDQVLTVDVHSPAAKGLYQVPLSSLSPAEIWAQNVPEIKDAQIAAPDQGAIQRCKAAAKAAGLPEEITFIEKRHTDGIIHQSLNGQVTPNMIIIDDVLDTGATLALCAERLRQNGAENISAAVSHALFTKGWEQIWDAGIQKLYCLDTVPSAKNLQHPNVHSVSVAPLIRAMLAGCV